MCIYMYKVMSINVFYLAFSFAGPIMKSQVDCLCYLFFLFLFFLSSFNVSFSIFYVLETGEHVFLASLGIRLLATSYFSLIKTIK